LAACASTAAPPSRQHRSRVLWDQDFRMSVQLTDVVIDAVGKELFSNEILQRGVVNESLIKELSIQLLPI
jgi:hypothetical protein